MLGSSTFIVLAIGTLAYAGRAHARPVVATIVVCCWALRLGGFLVFRVFKLGSDSRFDEAKKKPGAFGAACEPIGCVYFSLPRQNYFRQDVPVLNLFPVCFLPEMAVM